MDGVNSILELVDKGKEIYDGAVQFHDLIGKPFKSRDALDSLEQEIGDFEELADEAYLDPDTTAAERTFIDDLKAEMLDLQGQMQENFDWDTGGPRKRRADWETDVAPIQKKISHNLTELHDIEMADNAGNYNDTAGGTTHTGGVGGGGHGTETSGCNCSGKTEPGIPKGCMKQGEKNAAGLTMGRSSWYIPFTEEEKKAAKTCRSAYCKGCPYYRSYSSKYSKYGRYSSKYSRYGKRYSSYRKCY